MLNSDAKSDIEGLRWVLIRRSAMGIVLMAFMALATLRYASHTKQQRKEETKRQARDRDREAEETRLLAGKQDNATAPEAAEILAAA